MRRSVGLAGAGFALVSSLCGVRVAEACSFVGSKVHVIDPEQQAHDHAPPALEPPSVGISRGRGRGLLGCSEGSTCDDFGVIQLTLTATDDQSPEDQIGYRLKKVSGTLPDRFALPADVLRRAEDGLVLIWYDEPEVDQEPFDFTVEIVAIDVAGNESAPQTVRIAHGGEDGCRVAGHGGLPADGGTALAMAMVLLACARRGRRRGVPR